MWCSQMYDSGLQWYSHPAYVGVDWSLVLLGYKPLDMAQPHTLWSTDAHNLTIAQETNGAISVNFGNDRTTTNEYQTPSGLLTKWACHMVAVTYVHATKTVTVYVGDWNGNFHTASGAPSQVQGGGDGALQIGLVDSSAPGSLATYRSMDGFVDDACVYLGHAITAAEAAKLHAQCGYTAPISYPQSKGHRNNPWNRGAVTGSPTLYTSSAAAATQLNADRQLHANAINYYQFDDPIYVVSGAYRKNPANCRPFTNMRYDGSVDAALNGNWADVPVPYLGTGNAEAFGPAGGSDGHCTIYCPDTDEVWDMGVFRDTNYWQARVTTTSGSPNVTLDPTANPAVFPSGATITGQGTFPGGTTVLTPWDGTKVVMSANATVTGTGEMDITPVSPEEGYTCVYGNKLSQFSVDPGFFEYPRQNEGARATGIPGIYGTPTIAELQSPDPIPHAVALVVPRARSYPAAFWPAQRTDGSSGSGYALVEGMWLRLKQDPATTALIAAMPYPAGRKLALACQQYGAIIVDSTGYNCNFPVEDGLQFATVNGYNAYTQDAVGVTGTGGIFKGGDPYDGGNLSGFPWANFEVIDPTLANPTSGTQPRLSAPIGLSGHRTNNWVTLNWLDQALAQSFNIYSFAGGSYTLVASSQFPSYTLWYPSAGPLQLAVTAVNGGGESAKSAVLTPLFTARSRRRNRTNLG
jgi:hypothetical protein